MQTDNLLSREWCEILFAHRNKAYGAYRLRARAGARHRFALLCIIGALGLLLLVVGGFRLYVYIKVKGAVDEAEDLFAKRPADLREGYELKFIQTARQAPPRRMAPGAKSAVPVIVDGEPPVEVIGADGPIDFDPEQSTIITPIVDTTGISDKTLPVAKEKVVPTERVSQKPEFPGGDRAFNRWLDENIPYPQASINARREGLVTISFVINAEGRAVDFEIKNTFDAKVHRAIEAMLRRMPLWTPGTDETGRPCDVMITIPVDFKVLKE